MDAETTPKRSERLLSIDALRGFDMFWIIGGDALFRALARWSGSPAGETVRTQLEHAKWDGFRFYDLIFPLFLFLVGVVLPFSLGKLEGQGKWAEYRRIARRTVLLFSLGLLCNGVLKFDWENLRVAGVLQRIAICYGVAAVISLATSTRALVFVVGGILLGYWALLANVAAPGSTPGDYSIEGNLCGWVDRHFLPGKIMKAYYGYGDNAGLLSTIPALATTLIGVLAGRWLRSDQGPWTKVAGLAAAGVLCVVGEAWGARFPVIKNMWTSSFVLVAAGWSLLLLATFYAVIDVLRFRRWAFFFVVIGANAITIYVAPRFLDFAHFAQFFLGGVYRLAEQYGSPELKTVVIAASVLAAKWLFLLYLYRNRIFLRV